MATLVQYLFGGNPVLRFLEVLKVVRDHGGAVYSEGEESAHYSGVFRLSGEGFTYADGALLTGAVTGLKRYDDLLVFSGFNPISAAEAMAILNGNDGLFYNIIQTNRWDYTGSSEADDFAAGQLNDVLNGGGGNDNLQGGGGNDSVTGDGGADTLFGGADNDTIDGGADNDALYGGSGNDALDGGAGLDTMYGGTGNDTFYVDSNSDKVRENVGEGSDTVISRSSFSLHASAEIEFLLTTNAAGTLGFFLTGNDFSQTITANAGNNRLDGKGGNDILEGGAGADTLTGGSGTDSASYRGAKGAVGASLWNPASNTGDAKGDTFSSIERLIGSSFSDRLEGNVNANRLFGEAGNDRIYGGSGADHLYGGTGADSFIFKKISESTISTRDMIYDFSRAGGDKINLSAIDASTKISGNQAFTFIGEQAFHKKAGELRYINQSGDTFVYGDVNGDGKTDFSVRIDKTVDFVKGDFIL